MSPPQQTALCPRCVRAEHRNLFPPSRTSPVPKSTGARPTWVHPSGWLVQQQGSRLPNQCDGQGQLALVAPAVLPCRAARHLCRQGHAPGHTLGLRPYLAVGDPLCRLQGLLSASAQDRTKRRQGCVQGVCSPKQAAGAGSISASWTRHSAQGSLYVLWALGSPGSGAMLRQRH